VKFVLAYWYWGDGKKNLYFSSSHRTLKNYTQWFFRLNFSVKNYTDSAPKLKYLQRGYRRLLTGSPVRVQGEGVDGEGVDGEGVDGDGCDVGEVFEDGVCGGCSIMQLLGFI